MKLKKEKKSNANKSTVINDDELMCPNRIIKRVQFVTFENKNKKSAVLYC